MLNSFLDRWRELALSLEAWYLDLFRALGWVDPGQAGRIAVGVTHIILAGGMVILL